MFSKITRKNLEVFLRNNKTNKRILDVGGGSEGHQIFKELFPNRITVNISPKQNPDVVGDAHTLPFKDGEFEYVLCTEVLEHLVEPQKAINEMNRVLAKGGTLLLTTRFVFPIHDAPNDYWRFTKYGLEELFKKWEVVEIVPETRMFSTIGALLQRIAFQSKLRLNKLMKLKLFVAAWILDHSNYLIKEEFGDIERKTKVDHIMPTGYYVVAKKRR